MSDNPIDLKLIKEVPSFFEKVAETRFLYIFIAFIFALDSALVYFAHKNLLTLSITSPEITIGNAIVFFGVFSFLIGVCFPILRIMGRYLSGLPLLVATLFFNWGPAYRIVNYFSNAGYNSIFEARRKALLEQNEFDLKLIDHHFEQQSKIEKQLDLVFAMTVLFVCNYWIFGDQSVQTIRQIFVSLLDQPMGFWTLRALQTICSIFFLSTVGVSLYGLRPIQFQNDPIYLPKREEKAPKSVDPDLP